MSFLTIPSQEGLFTTVKAGKSAEEGDSTSPVDGDDEDEEDDEDDGSEEVKFILRSSPIPRRRGQSICDEAAEYLRIQLSLSAGRSRVSFADTTGGDLVDVREFVDFGSDEEEEEDPRFKQSKQSTCRIHTDFNVATRSALAEAVRTNKVEVELLSPMENEPLAFTGLVRVLNISYHKAVYIRSTMDHWATYYDHPAEYVQGSNDGESDAFHFKLSFSPPYDTHGSRIEFVVRYETSDGDFWANNSHMNYVVTLLVSYEDHLTPVNTDTRQEIRGILKAPKVYSVHNDGEQHMDEEEPSTSSHSETVRPTPVCPIIIHPEIDLETADDPFDPPLPPDQELQSLDDAGVPHRSPCTSPRNTTDQPLHVSSQDPTTLQSGEAPSSPSPSLPCELDDQISERLEEEEDGSRSALQPVPTPFPPGSSTSSLAEGAEQAVESFALDKLKPFTINHSPIREACVHFSSEIDEEELLHMTMGERKIKVAQLFPRGEKDLLNERRNHTIKDSEGGDVSSITLDSTSSTKQQLDSQFTEQRHSESSLQKEISLDDVVGDLTSLETEETLQTAPLASLKDLGIPDVSSTPHTFETPTTTEVEDIDTVEAHPCATKQSESTSADSETEQDFSAETRAVSRSRSDDHSDKEPNTKTDPVDEEQATPGDTAAFSENGETARQATARSDAGETDAEESSDNLRRSYTTTQTPPVDTDLIFSDAFEHLKEPSPGPEEEFTGVGSSDAWFTPTADSPPGRGSPRSVGPDGFPWCPPEAESRVSPGAETPAATTANGAAGYDTSAAADVGAARGETAAAAAAAPRISSDAWAERRADAPSEAGEPPRSERGFRLGLVFLCAAVSISVVLKEPGFLFWLGLALVALFSLMTSG